MIFKVKYYSTFLSILITLFHSTHIFSQNTIPPTKESRIDSIFTDYSKGNFPGAAVIVAKDGKILYQKCFGYANIQHCIPVITETKFRIGSIGKQFTASAILELQEQGLLNISDPLTKYISDYPRGNEITLYHLLTHTSGIQNYTQKDGFWIRSKIPIEPDSLINQFKYDSLKFSPGEDWQYSNSNYFLLGQIIEKVSGKTYAEYLNATFFVPLGMKNTGVHDMFEVYDNAASGYEYGQGKIYNAEQRHDSHIGGAGNLYSTAKDLFVWNEAIFNGEALSESSYQNAMTPVKWGDGKEVTADGFKYGCGWGIMNYKGVKLIAHGGGFNGFDCWISRYPDHNVTIVVLTNSNSFPEVLASRKATFKIVEVYLEDYMDKY